MYPIPEFVKPVIFYKENEQVGFVYLDKEKKIIRLGSKRQWCRIGRIYVH